MNPKEEVEPCPDSLLCFTESGAAVSSVAASLALSSTDVFIPSAAFAAATSFLFRIFSFAGAEAAGVLGGTPLVDARLEHGNDDGAPAAAVAAGSVAVAVVRPSLSLLVDDEFMLRSFG